MSLLLHTVCLYFYMLYVSTCTCCMSLVVHAVCLYFYMLYVSTSTCCMSLLLHVCIYFFNRSLLLLHVSTTSKRLSLSRSSHLSSTTHHLSREYLRTSQHLLFCSGKKMITKVNKMLPQ
ncbi:hypothetical protein DPEC_G00101750 [Dallia pectoralis]|uniref:Uncharacterized protein n=1 Tax=Dallia pectoralis TaxID=75939 RepID=A0ACC2GWU9_DALPE|nr:hypothetical protein DPEC_G00101750 [Dallia pectoralis]